jgi:hypothetical protein
MKIHFGVVSEFCDELVKNPPDVEKVVRATQVQRVDKNLVLTHLTFRASYLRTGPIGPVIVEVEEYLGSLWTAGPDVKEMPENRQVLGRLESSSKKLEDACSQLGLEVRSGHYEE